MPIYAEKHATGVLCDELPVGKHQQQMTPKHTHTHTFNGPFSGTTQVSQYQKGKNQSGFY